MTFNLADFYDAELRWLDTRFRAALKVGRRDRVLDIGCGAGQSTRFAARAATEGSVVGVDVSEDLLQAARRRTAQEGLDNVAFELADAQTHAFPDAHFDLCISRFGTMFFSDPLEAFVNIGRSMRSGARLVLMVWQSRERNEWAVAIPEALALGDDPCAKPSPAFSLGEPRRTSGILAAAGFASIDFAEVSEPVFYGETVEAAYEAVVGLFLMKDAKGTAEGKLHRLRALLEAHASVDGVRFGSCAWIVTARRL